MNDPRIYILVLNWNGWGDTLECLESVFRATYPDYRVIVCDNCSTDGSMARIKAWANGDLEPYNSTSSPPRRLAYPPIPKPVPYVEIAGHDVARPEFADTSASLILIQTGANSGYAAGNNVGIRYALARGDFEYIWLLNNDTVIDGNALGRLAATMQAKPRAGFCGSLLLEYAAPHRVQAMAGASYNKWLAQPACIGRLKGVDDIDAGQVEGALDYIIGASMLVRKAVLVEIGLLCEDYFLYFEELDWAERARAKYGLAFAADSIVYHKEGSSIGTGADHTSRSALADYYIVKNKIAFTRKFHPLLLPFVLLTMAVVIFNRIRRSQMDRVPLVLGAVLSGLFGKTGVTAFKAGADSGNRDVCGKPEVA